MIRFGMYLKNMIYYTTAEESLKNGLFPYRNEWNRIWRGKRALARMCVCVGHIEKVASPEGIDDIDDIE